MYTVEVFVLASKVVHWAYSPGKLRFTADDGEPAAADGAGVGVAAAVVDGVGVACVESLWAATAVPAAPSTTTAPMPTARAVLRIMADAPSVRRPRRSHDHYRPGGRKPL